jgi:hypothetical protein
MLCELCLGMGFKMHPYTDTITKCITIIHDLWTSGFEGSIPGGAGNFSLHQRVQNGFGAHPASYPMGTRESFPGSEADHSLPSSAEVKECMELYLHSPNTPSWRGAQLKHRELIIVKVHSMLSRDSSVGIPTGYGLDDRVRFPAGTGNLYLRHRVQTGFGAHPASYPVGIGGSFPGVKAAET